MNTRWVIGLVVAVAIGCEDGSSTTPTPEVAAADGSFIPAWHTDGDESVLPITLPNRSSFELRYPAELDLARLGFVPVAAIDWPVRPDPLRCCGKTLSIHYERLENVWHGKPIATYPGAGGNLVPYYHASAAGRPLRLDYLVFQFGPWQVSAYDLKVVDPANFEDRMTDEERATWARSLGGRVDRDGFLVLEAEPPLTVADNEDFILGRADDRQLEFSDAPCDVAGADSADPRWFPYETGAGAAWCDPSSGLHVNVTGPDDFVNHVVAGLQITRR